MAAVPESGYLAVADLTGYTAYLARGELEHAPTIAGDLLETIVGRLDPPFRLAKLEGDAAFLWVEDGRAEGALLVDALEASYLAFRRRLRSIEAATACDSNACRMAPRLDLKLFLHHGSYVRSRIVGRDELAGPDVILVHRLLKGAAAADAGTQGFALFTSNALEALGLDPEALSMSPAQESFEHLGDVAAFRLDLEARWRAERERRRLDVDESAALLDLQVILRADPRIVWTHLTSPALRPLWEGPIAIKETSAGGWRGVGTKAQCVTGRLATIEEIVDWQPFEHIGWRIAVPGIGPVEAVAELEGIDAGTRLRLLWAAAPNVPVDERVAEGIRVAKRTSLARLIRLLDRGLPTVETH